ncbi:MAG TPA: hypothetical protein VJV79_22540 [Polyangiaceae bacterium]|nr:hypothetical protein [Polyangiaceae bacterium]
MPPIDPGVPPLPPAAAELPAAPDVDPVLVTPAEPAREFDGAGSSPAQASRPQVIRAQELTSNAPGARRWIDEGSDASEENLEGLVT